MLPVMVKKGDKGLWIWKRQEEMRCCFEMLHEIVLEAHSIQGIS